jgi:hypothetical protein
MRGLKALGWLVGILLLGLLLLGIAAAVASSASAASLRPAPVTLTVVNHTHVPQATILRMERAVQVQVNRQLDAFWYQTARIRFGSGGWPVAIVTGRAMDRAGYCGYHGPVVGLSTRLPRDVGGQPPLGVPSGVPYAVVGLSKDCDVLGASWSVVFSHEVMEMMVDPWPGSYQINGQWPEVGDPVNGIGYQLRGVRVSDFVTPAYFWESTGPYDQLRRLSVF